MRKTCQLCHAQLSAQASETATACPACGGALVLTPVAPASAATDAPETVDHRGITLPARHAVGGIITPW